MFCQLDARYVIRYISPSVQRTLGFSPSQMIGSSFLDWFAQIHPDDRDDLQARFRAVSSSLSENTAEYRFLHADGHYVWLEARVRMIDSADGTSKDVIILAREISERKQAEQQLHLLAEAMRSIDDGVMITDANIDDSGPIIQFVNEALERITGYNRDELLGQSARVFLGPQTDSDVVQQLDTALRDGEKFHAKALNYRKDGSTYTIDWRVVPVRNAAGKVTHFVTTQRDISDSMRTEEALRDSEALFRAITEATIIAIGISRLSDGTIIYANTQGSTLLGLPVDDVVGKQAHFYLDDDERERLDALLERDGSVTDLEVRGKRADGESFWAVMSVRPVMLRDETHWLCSFSDITLRRAAENNLRQSQWRYESLVNSVDGIVWEGALDMFRTSFVSQQIERMLGFTVEECLSDPDFWRHHIYADDLPLLEAAFRTLSETGSYEVEYRLIAADGHVVWMRDIARLVSEDGTARVIGILVDISAYKKAQAAEQEQRALAEALRDTAATLSSTLDQDEVLDRILEQITKVVPHDNADIMLIETGVAYTVRSKSNTERGSAPVDSWPVATTPTLREMMDTGQPLVVTDVSQYSDWVDLPENPTWVRSYIGAPIRLDGRTIGFIHVNSAETGVFGSEHAARLQVFADQAAIAIRNARLYRLLEQRVEQRTSELALERNRMRVILDESGEGIYYSENGLIQYANQVIYEMTGYPSAELIGASFTLLNAHGTPEQDEERMLAVIQSGNIWRHDQKLKRKDGSEFDAGLTISLVGKPEADMLRTVTIVRDISQEKALSAQKARFVAHASHELRTPLTNLVTRMYLLRRQPERLPDHLQVLDEVVARMRRLVEDLLDISRFERGVIPLKRQPLILQDLVAGVVRVQQPEAERKGIAMTLTATDRPLRVNVDLERIIQVVTNLLINAVNYTPDGGYIRVEVSEHSGYGIISVCDNGIGIPSEHLSFIFQPFYRVMGEAQGTGLGLSIAKEIIELHSGEISVESTPGNGSCFTIRLALVEAPTSAIAPESEAEIGRITGLLTPETGSDRAS